MAFVSDCAKSTSIVKEAGSISEACGLLQDTRCVIVPKLFSHRISGLPPDYEVRDMRLDENESDVPFGDILHQFCEAHRAFSGKPCARGRVARVSGTPCPRAHVDYLGLRILVTLEGPGVVLLTGPSGEILRRTEAGDVVFMLSLIHI